MRSILSLFFKAEGTNSWAVLACLLMASLIEGVGFASLVPLLTVATGTQEGDSSRVTEITRELMATLGLPMEVGILLFFFVTAMVLKSLLSFVAMTYVGNAVAKFSTGLRAKLLHNIFRVKWGYLIHRPIGQFTNAITSQAERASRAYQLVASFFSQLIQAVAYFAVAFVISWPLALTAIGVGAVMVATLHTLVRLARKAGLRETQRYRELTVFLTDTLINIKPLRAMTRHAAFSNFLERKIISLKKTIQLSVISSEGLKNGQEILIAVVLGIGAYVVITYWQFPIIELAVVGVLLKRSTNSITKVQRIYQEAMYVVDPYLEIMGLIDDTGRVPEPNPGSLQASFRQGCHLHGVSLSHGDKEVLQSVTMDIPVGCVTVLTGPSGSGKTTIADIIIGLYPPDGGQVLIDDQSLQDIDIHSWRQLIGYVPQDLVLFHDTIFSNIGLGDPGITEQDARRALEMAGAWEFIQAMPDGMMTVVGQHGAKLSGGQRQRIAIARALVLKPRLLILDEVTSALDPKTEIEICQNIRSLSGETTILAITHRPALLEIADRVYRIKDGIAEEAQTLTPATNSP